MGKAVHKPKPSIPNWAWLDRDGCWFCKNKNGCNRCKINKKLLAEINKFKKEVVYERL